MGNPLLGWLGSAGTNQPPSGGQGGNPLGAMPGLNIPGLNMPGGMPSAPAGAAGSQNPYGMGARGGGDLGYNLAQTNLQSGLYKNQLAPLFAQMMMGTGGNAANFYNTLMNLGSPYYQQGQRASWEQGVGQSQNAAAQARQQLQASGAGYTPSGAGAAMFGGMGQAEAGNMALNYLQNLFQNEQLQAAGAGGLANLAQMFNPAQLLTGINPQIQQPTNTGAEWMGAAGQLLGAPATAYAGR